MELSPLRIVISGIDNYSKEMNKINKQVTGLAKGLSDIGGKMSTAISAPLAAAAGLSVMRAAQVSDSMAEVQTVTGATAAEMVKLNTAARSMAGIGVGPAKAAELLKDLANKGMGATDALSALSPVLKMAGAGSLEMGDAAEVVDGLMDSFGVTAAGLAPSFDKLFLTSTKAGIGFKDLTGMLGDAGPVFQQMGVSMDQALVLIRGFDSAGVDAGAGVQSLSKAMAMLNHPSAATVETFKKLGLHKNDFFTADGKMKDMVSVVDSLSKSGATAKDIYAAFGDKVGKNLAPLVTQGADTLRQYSEELKNSGGALDALSKNKLTTLAGTLKIATAQLDTVAVAIGDKLAPAIQSIWEKISPLISAFANMPAPMLGAVVAFGALAAAIGPVLVVAGSVIEAFATVSEAIAGAGGVIALVSNPIGWIIGGAILLTAAFIALGDTIDPLKNSIGTALAIAGQVLMGVWAQIVPVFTNIWGIFVNLIRIVQPFTPLLLTLAAIWAAFTFGPFIAGIAAVFFLFKGLVSLLKMVTDGWVLLFGAVGDFFSMLDKSMGGPVGKLIDKLAGLMQAMAGGKKTIAVEGSAPGATPGPKIPGLPGGMTPGAAGAAAGSAAIARATGQPVDKNHVIIDFRNMPSGVAVSQQGTGAKINGYTGTIMQGVI